MSLIIENGTVLTMDDARQVYFGGHVVLDGDRIAAVGSGRYPGPVQAGDEVIDAAGMAVLPGLVDLHFHTAIGKGFSDHLPLWEYLETCWYPLIRNLDADAALWGGGGELLVDEGLQIQVRVRVAAVGFYDVQDGHADAGQAAEAFGGDQGAAILRLS